MTLCDWLSPSSLSVPSEVNSFKDRAEGSLAALQMKAWLCLLALTSKRAGRSQL